MRQEGSGLFERVRTVLVAAHYSDRTVKAYGRWVREFVQFHGRRHPRESRW